MAVGYQTFYTAQLTNSISDTELTIPLDIVPIPSEGYLVIESTVTNKREVIYYTSKTSNSVVCPSDGRGYDGTTAVSHLQGAAVIMAPVGAMFTSLTDLFTTTPQGWTNSAIAISAVTANGNRSYTLTHASSIASIITPGFRRRFTRTVAAPTQCTSLNGTNQYWVKTSPNKLTFTDDFVVSAWVKLAAYPTTNPTSIASRYNGTNGWVLRVETTGQIMLIGTNAASGNFSYVQSYQSIPLNKWVHVTAQLDMSTFTATTTTSYVMIDGVDVPASVARAGTNPTALIQAGDLQIGTANAGASYSFFNGKIAQVAIFNAKVTQANMKNYIDRGLSGSETSLACAYSFNGVATDLNTTTPNDLTAQNSAAATNADSPFGNGGISSTLEYGLTMSVSADGLTEVVQCPEGCALPTTGGITASAYSTMANPYGWPAKNAMKWDAPLAYTQTTTATAVGTAMPGAQIASVYLTVGKTIRFHIRGLNLHNSGANTCVISIHSSLTLSAATQIGQYNWALGTNSFGQNSHICWNFDYTIPNSGNYSFAVGFYGVAGTTTANFIGPLINNAPSGISLEVIDA